jgi:DNA-directed RNA polymerase sigma subunit (sigma70/sigma32)
VPPDVSLTRLLDPAAPPEDRDGLERSELLAALLRHCDDRERRLLVQTLGAGITYESAGRAEVPPISKERVRQILLRAVLRLRRAARDMGLPAPVTWSTNLQHRAGR